MCGQTRNTLMCVVHVHLPVFVGDHAHQLSNTCSALVKLSSCLLLGECSKWVRLHACALWYACCWILFACDQQHHSLCLLHASGWDEPITCMGTVSSICACCTLIVIIPTTSHSLSYATPILTWVVSWSHATPSLFWSLPSHDLHVLMSSHSISI